MKTSAREIRDLVALAPEHPGFADPTYRARRNAIAHIALRHQSGTAVPRVRYTAVEHRVWRVVAERRAGLLWRAAARELAVQEAQLGLNARHIPQLAELNRQLEPATGLRFEPVAGLVEPRAFLSALGAGVFLSTQYIRHEARPFFTPEPDLLHEVLGHLASLHHPALARVNRTIGRAAELADEAQLARLERLYWFSLEFGAVLEAGQPRAVGAGLLSSCDELGSLGRVDGPQLERWDLDVMARTDFDPSSYQGRLFVAPSLARFATDLIDWLQSEHPELRDAIL